MRVIATVGAGERDAAPRTAARLHGIAIPTSIGFTMSLFIGTLAFHDESIPTHVRLGVLVASLVSGIAGALLLLAGRRNGAAT
jgi:NhaA family Na+:H+ antiporter